MRWKVMSIVTFIVAAMLQVIAVSPAEAWSGHLPDCSGYPYNWETTLQADSRYTKNTSWVAFKRNWSGIPFNGGYALSVIWNQPNDSTASQNNQIYFVGDGTDNNTNGLSVPTSGSMFVVNPDGSFTDMSSTWSGGGSYGTFFDVNCVHDTHNVGYLGWLDTPPYPDEMANAKYVSMGDSYSSGEGNPPFEGGTDTSTDKCHRSSVAYPERLNSLSGVGPMHFVACSGATTQNILYGGQGEPPQVNALVSGVTKAVTITVGGNDVKFPVYANKCVEKIPSSLIHVDTIGFTDALPPICGPGTQPWVDIMGQIADSGFSQHLNDVYTAILQRAPSAQIYIMGYPYLTNTDAMGCISNGFYVDASGARSVDTALNNKIQATVKAMNNSNLHYVDPNAQGSPFIGKYFCGTSTGPSDFNGVDSINQEYSFHPNSQGQADYETVILSYLANGPVAPISIS